MSTIRLALINDLPFLRHLQRCWPNALGYLPDSALSMLIESRSVLLAKQRGQECGMLITRPRLATSPTVRPILQAAVDMQAQRRHHGLALLAKLEADSLPDRISVLQCWCRSELEANSFWAAAGFLAIAQRPGGKRLGGSLTLWAKTIAPIDAAALLLKRHDRPRGPGGTVSSTRLRLWPTDAFFDDPYTARRRPPALPLNG